MQLSKMQFLQIILLGCWGECPECPDDPEPPNFLCDACEQTIDDGGVAGWFLKRCDYEFTDITDEAEWITAIENKQVFGRVDGTRILGGISAPDYQTKVFGSCGPEETTRKQRTVSIVDNASDSELSINDVYNFLEKQKPGRWEIGYVTCGGHFIGWFPSVGIRTFRQVPDTKNENTFWTAEFRFDERKGEWPEFILPFLLDIAPSVCWVTSIVVSSTGTPPNEVVNGNDLQMTATVLPTNATDATVAWSVVNGTGSATIVPATGLLTATGVGTVTVYATANDASGIVGSLVVTVTV